MQNNVPETVFPKSLTIKVPFQFQFLAGIKKFQKFQFQFQKSKSSSGTQFWNSVPELSSFSSVPELWEHCCKLHYNLRNSNLTTSIYIQFHKSNSIDNLSFNYT